jgi:hypothetical protein
MTTALDILRKLLRDPAAAAGLLIILLLVLTAIFAPQLATHPEAIWDMNPRQRLLPPSEMYVFGTDRMGADIYSRILFGARITMVIASVAVGVALLIGVPIGLISGWTQNWLGEALMRVSDIFLAVPQIVLAIAISQTLGPSIENVILALSVTYWPWFTRLVHRGGDCAGGSNLADHFAARTAERRLSDHRADLDRHGLYHPHRQRTRVSRSRCAAPGARMGTDDRRVTRVPPAGVVVCAGARACDLPCRDGLQPVG